MNKYSLEEYSPKDMKAAASMCLMHFSALKNVDKSDLKVGTSKQKAMSEIRAAIKEVKKTEILDREHNVSRDLQNSPLREYKYNSKMARRVQKTTGEAMEKKRKRNNEASRKSRFQKTQREFLCLKLNKCSAANIETLKTYIDADEEGIKDFEKLLGKIGCDDSFMDKLKEPYQHDYTYPNKFRPMPADELKKD